MRNISIINIINHSRKSFIEKLSTPYGMIISAITLFLALISISPIVKTWIKGSSEKDYLGIWYSNYTDITANDISCHQEGATELYKNNKYSYAGIISCYGKIGSVELKNKHGFTAGGEWLLDDDRLVFEIKDVNSYEILSTINDLPILNDFNNHISDQITKHRPFSFKILEKHKDRIKLKKETLTGNSMTVVFYKKEKAFVMPISSL